MKQLLVKNGHVSLLATWKVAGILLFLANVPVKRWK
jgi:hypothetical protein